MKFWWHIDTVRLGAEKRAIEQLAATERWFELGRWWFHEGNLAVEGDIVAHGHNYSVRLVYPDQFPDVPAWVEPQEKARWTIHQYGAGALCLQLRSDNWVSTATGADVLRSAYDLLMIENPLGTDGKAAPSAHHVGELQKYDWGENPVLIGAGCRGRVRSAQGNDLKALRWMAADDVWPILLHDRVDREGAKRPPDSDIRSWRVELPVHVSREVPPLPSADRAALLEATGFERDTCTILSTTPSVVVFTGGPELEVFHLLDKGDPSHSRLFVLQDDIGVRSNRVADTLDKRVAIIGAGSIGSKIADSLVRSGIHRLTIVDGDILLPGNLERHVLDWRSVGFRKAHGLKRHLLDIAPGAEVVVVDDNLNWQRSARTHSWQVASIAGCDVIVDATGDSGTSLFLGAVAAANEKAFVSVEVFEGGLGALIATSLPGRDPPFAAGRAAFLAWCDMQGVHAPEPGPRRYEALAADGTPLAADDAAVTMTAGHASRTILDIWDGRPAPIKSAWLLLGYRKEWLFDGHGHVIGLDVGARASIESPGEDPAARDFVNALAEAWLGETKSGS